MAKDFIEKRETGYYVFGNRVSLDSILYGFLDGMSAEGILESFPTLTLEQVHGSLAYYLANRDVIDKYLAEGEREAEKMRVVSRAERPLLFSKLERARRTLRPQKVK